MIVAKKRNFFIFLFLVGIITIVNPAFAATCDPNNPYFCNPLNLGGDGIDTIADALIIIIQFLLSVIGLISMAFIIISGLKYLTSAGNEESITSAKNTLTSALMGVILALMAFGIIEVIQEILEVKN
ncbi:MAG: hypothetical protein WC178_00070 [Candidatus Paceibacterota bacterium]